MGVLRWVTLATVLTAVPAAAYDTLEQDYALCTQGKDRNAVVAACTRLIDNSSGKGPLVGMFYGMRAATNNDRAQNCADAKKSLSMAEDDKLKALSQQLVDVNC